LAEHDDRYVFVSYSSRDRDRVLPIVEAIQEHGVETWIDKNRIPGGGDYTQEIPGAIGRAACITVFLSPNAFKSRNVKKELSLGWKKEKPIIPLLLEDVDTPEDFEYELEAVQTIRICERAREDWWRDLQHALASQQFVFDESIAAAPRSVFRLGSATSQHPFVHTPLMPYLVNRWQQEEQLRNLLVRHYDERWKHPVVIVTYGQTDQAVPEYLDRLERSSLPSHLRRVGYRDIVNWKNVPWPRGDWQVRPDETLLRLRVQTESVFELPRGSWPGGVIQMITSGGCAVVACIRLRWDQWNEGHLTALRAWIADWGTVPPVPIDAPLLVVLAVEYSALAKGWVTRMLSKKHSPHPIHRQLGLLSGATPPGISFVLMTELGNVTLQDIEDWILHDLKPQDPSAMIRRAREVLADPELPIATGVAMEHVADRLASLLTETSSEGTHR